MHVDQLLALPVRQAGPIEPLGWVLIAVAAIALIAFAIRHYRNEK
jgi:hypothetical protein